MSNADERAQFWRVTARTIRRWLAATPPVPVDDVDEMIKWHATLPFAKQSKLSPAFLRRLTELRMERERSTGAAVGTDPYYQEFVTARPAPTDPAAPASHATDGAYLADLKRRRDFAVFKLDRAQARNDLAGADDAARLLKLVAPIIHDEELRAQKLNREIGDMIPRADYERQLRAIAYWLVRTVDEAKAELSPRLAAASATGPLYRQEVDAILEPVLLTTRVLDPLRRSTDLPPGSGAALPAWAFAALRNALAAVIEDPDEVGGDSTAKIFAGAPPAPVPILNGKVLASCANASPLEPARA